MSEHRKATRTPYADGLSLITQPSGSARWYARFTAAGKRHNESLGSLEELPTEAAARAVMVERWKAAGYVPRSQRRTTVPVPAAETPTRPRRPHLPPPELPEPGAGTFGAYAEMEIAHKVPSGNMTPATAQEWERKVRRYCAPLWSYPASEVTPRAILDEVLKPAARAGQSLPDKLVVAIRQVLVWAVVDGTIQHNPAEGKTLADARRLVLPKPRAQHHGFVAWERAPEVAQVLASGSTKRACLLFILLTACRRGEAVGAKWAEFDFQAATWTVPAERTKTAEEHRVPLSRQALRLLQGVPVTGLRLVTEEDGLVGGSAAAWRAAVTGSEYVFSTAQGGPVSTTGLGRERRAIVGGTIHGFRSTFRSWCADHDYDRHLCEGCLGHVVGSAVERAYQRSDLLERRRPIMQAWADFCLPEG